MAAPSFDEVHFERQTPTIELIVNDLRSVTGLDMQVEKIVSRNNLNADRYFWLIDGPVKEVGGIDLFEEAGCWTIVYDGLFGASYLPISALFVLVKLGGKYAGTIPNWAGQEWREPRGMNEIYE